jgi:hypothetical protein
MSALEAWYAGNQNPGTIAEQDCILKFIHEESLIEGEGNLAELAYDQTVTVRTRF